MWRGLVRGTTDWHKNHQDTGIMRYQQSRQQSAEILRMALEHMSRHEAAFHPPSYALWYEHTAGINPTLTHALEERLASDVPLTDAEVLRMHARFVLTRDLDAFENIRDRIHAVLEDTSGAAANAGASASKFEAALQEQSGRLRQISGLTLIGEVVSELLSQTQHMYAATSELTRQLELSVKEIHTLTTQLEQAQSEALLDPLTGLRNRRGLERAVEDLSESGEVLPGGCSLLLADVDNFKNINDTHGHLLGDKVLRAIAQVLRAGIKGRDIAARLGGEEFAVLLPETSPQGARVLAEKLRESIAQIRIRRSNQGEYLGVVTVSIGISSASMDGSLDRTSARADEALYAAKRDGRNCVRLAGSTESEGRAK